ncbi:MAG: hypothetical protein LUC31_01950 [Coprobacillus sp.]|nr:hypothetical protein [Coprobacillus sp.]
MNVKNYLEKHQPILYKTFLNALESGNVSHAYLISGQTGSPLLEVAKFLGKSLLCENPTPFACEECYNCIRIDDDNYPDFVVIDGESGSIKIGEITNIEAQFDLKSFEAKGIIVYIINLVEKMTIQAINAMLKLLEEPKDNVYAFLTTQNENYVLPTIVSRCQSLKLVPIDREIIISEALELGVKREDAEILSYIYEDASLISDVVKNEGEYTEFIVIRDTIIDLIESLNDHPKAVYKMETNLIPLVKSKEDASYAVDILTLFFEEALNMKNGLSPLITSYDTILKDLISSVKHLDSCLVELLKAKVTLQDRANVSLLLDHLINEIISD